MVALSARFAVLACLCSLVAINLPPSVDAAYVQARHSEGKRVSHSFGAILGEQMNPPPTIPHPEDSDMVARHHTKSTGKVSTAKDEKGKNDKGKPTKKVDAGHKKAPKEVLESDVPNRLAGLRSFVQAQGRRDMGLPPLLRRRAVTGGYDHDHEHGHDNVYGSVFARHRHQNSHGRRARHHDRRSSVYVPGEHGDTYLVSRVQHGNGNDGAAGKDKQMPTSHPRRQTSQANPVLGTIDIMSPGQTAGIAQRLASLAADPSPINSTSGQNSTKAFALNASTTNQTQFIMTVMNGPPGATGGSGKPVALAMQVFDAASAETVMYCATYDPNPGAPSALMMKPCTTSSPSAADADLADPANRIDATTISGVAINENTVASGSHESQLFSYDPSSGQIQPMSVGANNAVAYDTSDSTDHTDPPTAGSAKRHMARNNGNSTTSGSAGPSSTLTSAVPSSTSSQQAQNVTLVFVPKSVEVPAQAPVPHSSASASPGMGQPAIVTTTITTTVFATATSSASNNTQSMTPAQAAASLTTSSEPCESTTSAIPSAQDAVADPSISLVSVLTSVASSLLPSNVVPSASVAAVKPSSTPNPVLAWATSSVSSSSVAPSTKTAVVTASSSRPALAGSSSSSATTSAASESLQVEVAAVTPQPTSTSTVTSVTATATATTTATTATTSTGSSGTSLDAQAVASSIANTSSSASTSSVTTTATTATLVGIAHGKRVFASASLN